MNDSTVTRDIIVGRSHPLQGALVELQRTASIARQWPDQLRLLEELVHRVDDQHAVAHRDALVSLATGWMLDALRVEHAVARQPGSPLDPSKGRLDWCAQVFWNPYGRGDFATVAIKLECAPVVAAAQALVAIIQRSEDNDLSAATLYDIGSTAISVGVRAGRAWDVVPEEQPTMRREALFQRMLSEFRGALLAFGAGRVR